MGFVFSPSNMGTYHECPLRFMGQSVTKEIKWRASKQKSRGTLVHQFLQEAVETGRIPVDLFNDSDIDMDFVRRIVDRAAEYRHDGLVGSCEKEMCMNRFYRPTGWWDEDAFIRARADALFLPPSDSDKAAVLWDFKTGRKWDEDDFQLRIEAVLVHLLYKVPQVRYAYLYVDSGEVVDGLLDFSVGIEPVRDIFETIQSMLLSIRDNDFPAVKNRFCKWCDFHQTARCSL